MDDVHFGILESCNGLLYLLDDYRKHVIGNTILGNCQNPQVLLWLYYKFSTDDYGGLFGKKFTDNDSKESTFEFLYIRNGHLEKDWKRLMQFINHLEDQESFEMVGKP